MDGHTSAATENTQALTYLKNCKSHTLLGRAEETKEGMTGMLKGSRKRGKNGSASIYKES